MELDFELIAVTTVRLHSRHYVPAHFEVCACVYTCAGLVDRTYILYSVRSAGIAHEVTYSAGHVASRKGHTTSVAVPQRFKA